MCLDELPGVGFCTEVEGPDEQQVTAVLKKLGLDGRPQISSSYARLTADAQKGITPNSENLNLQ